MNKLIALVPILFCILKNSHQADDSQESEDENCILDIRDYMKLDAEKEVHDRWPLVLEKIDNYAEFIEMPPNGIRYIKQGTMLRLACTGSQNRFVNVRTSIPDIMVKCIQGKTYEYEGTSFQFEDFGCAMIPESEEFEDYEEHHQIGFRLPSDNDFVPLIGIYVSYYHSTYDSHYYLHYSQVRQNSSIIDLMTVNHSLGEDIKKYYTKSVISEEMTKLLGEENAKKYFNENSFITKARVAPKGDFIFASQQLATFQYINCFPQFSGLKNHNWNLLEISIRNHFFDNSIKIRTGTHGPLRLPSQSNENESIYLAGDQNLPVPEVFWKLVETDFGKYAFIGFNYPTIDSDEFMVDDKKVCHDHCDDESFSWLHEGLKSKDSRRDPTKGYFFCCTYAELNTYNANYYNN